MDLVIHRFVSLLVQQTGTDEGLSHTVWVAVGRWAAVLEVAPLLLADITRNADAGPTVGHACGEFIDV